MQNNKSVILKSGIKVHDFRPHRLGWGWVGMSWRVHQDGTSAMIGIGSGLKQGDFIAIILSGEMDGEITGHEIKSIDYETNPKDMFSAVLSGTYSFEDHELNEINSKILIGIDVPKNKCAVKSISDNKNCPEIGVHKIENSDDYLCERCYNRVVTVKK